MAYVTDGLVLNLDAKNQSNLTVWEDTSGLGNHATLYGFNGSAASGWNNEELYFDGVDDYALIDRTNLPTSYTNFTVTIAMIVTGNTGSYDMPLYWGASSASSAGFDFELGSGSWRFAIADGSKNASSSITPIYNTFFEITLTIDRSTNKMIQYINGVYVKETDISLVGTITPSTALYLSRSGSNKFLGSMASVKLYTKALTADEVLQNYNETIQQPSVDLTVESSVIGATAQVLNSSIEAPKNLSLSTNLFNASAAVFDAEVVRTLNKTIEVSVVGASGSVKDISVLTTKELILNIGKSDATAAIKNASVSTEKNRIINNPLLTLTAQVKDASVIVYKDITIDVGITTANAHVFDDAAILDSVQIIKNDLTIQVGLSSSTAKINAASLTRTKELTLNNGKASASAAVYNSTVSVQIHKTINAGLSTANALINNATIETFEATVTYINITSASGTAKVNAANISTQKNIQLNLNKAIAQATILKPNIFVEISKTLRIENIAQSSAVVKSISVGIGKDKRIQTSLSEAIAAISNPSIITTKNITIETQVSKANSLINSSEITALVNLSINTNTALSDAAILIAVFFANTIDIIFHEIMLQYRNEFELNSTYQNETEINIISMDNSELVKIYFESELNMIYKNEFEINLTVRG